jgi:hypothetical protein
MGKRRSGFTTVVIVLVAVSLSGSASGRTTASGRVLVTAAGHVGPLRIDESDRVDVIAFAGQRKLSGEGVMHLRTRRSTLSGTAATASRPPIPPESLPAKPSSISTLKSGKLELFYTEDEHYSNLRGVHVGTTTAAAEALMHRLVIGGCFDGLRVDTKTGFLVMWLEGGKDQVHRHPYYLHLVGGHVGFIVVHSRRLNPGVLDCIDS